MKDSTLKQDVIDELEFEPSIDANDIGVAVEDGIVMLSGHVSSFAEKTMVQRAVERIKGVKGIADEIEVRYPGHASTSDDEVAKRTVDMLKWSTVVPADKVHVRVQKGWVTLTGSVDWNYQKAGAADAVKGLLGVTGISNLIELQPRVSSLDVKKHIENALRRNAEIEAKGITVNVAGNKVTLEGNVKAWYERRVAEQAAWATPGVTTVDDRLTIA
ncbi:MAG: BON domain-containing protein [Devosia sp.]